MINGSIDRLINNISNESMLEIKLQHVEQKRKAKKETKWTRSDRKRW